MKLVAEQIVENSYSTQTQDAIEGLRIDALRALSQAIENKIDWDVVHIDKNNTKFIASIHVMNNAEWKTAKDILKSLIEKFPDSDEDIKRVFSIIDPLGNFN
jgi:hypothetical protein